MNNMTFLFFRASNILIILAKKMVQEHLFKILYKLSKEILINNVINGRNLKNSIQLFTKNVFLTIKMILISKTFRNN
jgi:hypothetical protein